MFNSIIEDIKYQINRGNMLTKLIILNIAVFVLVNLVHLFMMGDPALHDGFMRWISMNGELWTNVKRPWVLLTHMFVHEGLFHILFNMLLLYWFGRIVGDFLGDRRIWPIYVLGGLAGAAGYLIFVALGGNSSMAFGASGAVMAFVVASASVTPDYTMRLILIGDVKLKYIALVLVLIDLATAWQTPGTAAAHLAGAAMGWIFIASLRAGNDLSIPVNRISDALMRPFNNQTALKTRQPMVVVHKAIERGVRKVKEEEKKSDVQEQVDAILDKINEQGYESLTDEEKDILYKASKQ
jgi:membrane associated rhomboid family serine protease